MFALRLTALGLVLGLAGCAASDLDGNAAVLVSGDATSTEFSWAADHPWVRQFQAQGSRIRLYAQYRSAGQPVEQDLGAGTPVSAAQLRYRLPTTLRAVPDDGAVCLFLSTSRTGAAIPVRLSAKAQGDTARFRNPAWEGQVRTSTRSSLVQRDIDELTQGIAALDRSISGVQQGIAAMRVGSVADCPNAKRTAARNAQDDEPKVMSMDEIPDGAQRVCVRRARNMRNAQVVDVPQLVKQFNADQRTPGTARAHELAQKFQQHWAKWLSATGAGYVPEVGRATDTLPTGGALDGQIKQLNGNPASAPTLAPLVAMGLLDSYAGCLEDVGKQLRAMRDAQLHEQTNKPMRDQAYAEHVQKQCVANFDQLAKLTVERGEQQSRLVERQEALKQTASGRVAAPSGLVPLNQLECNL
jgi:hypothetical protein